MVDNRNFSKVLTVLLVIIGIAILVALGFMGYDILQSYYINKGANEVVNEFDKELQNQEVQNTVDETAEDETQDENVTSQNQTGTNRTTQRRTQTKKNVVSLKYKGFDVVGKIEIPKTNVNYPVLSKATISSMEVSVGVSYGPGLNQVGNTVIMGHNYRTNALFSKNKNLNNGDVIYITDLSGERVKYVIYNKYETSSTDFDYATRDTEGRREITLASCTDDTSSRIILWAKEEK